MGGSQSTGKSRTMAMKFVTEAIAKDKVVIFSKMSCPYCRMAKKQFEEISEPYTSIELDSRSDAADIQASLGEITGATTVPRVFVRGVFIGGGTDVKKLNETGKLRELVE